MEVGMCNAQFSLLPAHIITQILRYLNLDDLSNASLVCKSWYFASTDPQIARTLIIQPDEANLFDMCSSNRRYGILKLEFLEFHNVDSYYFEFFEKICPFIKQLQIRNSDLKIHHLLKLFELVPCLNVLVMSECSKLAALPGLFPLDYDCNAKSRIVKNLSAIKTIVIEHFINIPLISDLVHYTTNLNSFEFSNEFLEFKGHSANLYEQFFTIFKNNVAASLKHLKLFLNFTGLANDFINNFVKIENLNLISFTIIIWWVWDDGVYKSSLFRQLILKLKTLKQFTIYGLKQDQLSIICEHLVNLESLDCQLGNDQAISKLVNLKLLKKLCCRFSQDTNRRVNLLEINSFFQSKFEYLQVLNFEEFVTESNLENFCANHPNLTELKLTNLLTRNLEIIFKYLTKLRVLNIYFGFTSLRPDITERLKDLCLLDLKREYEYKISRLRDLEEFYLAELVYGIRNEDVKHLKKLWRTNLPELLSNSKLYN